ncbi:OmpA family protein [Brevibacterium sp. JNUCC-42]|nr:OmpA family protein [Brevibacterium sp. JNUCC-42]
MQDDRLYDEKELEKSWLLSYSDLITLLFIIVILIAAMYTAQVKQQQQELQQKATQTTENAEIAKAEQAVAEMKKKTLEAEIRELSAKRDVVAIGAGQQPEQDVDSNMQVVKEKVGEALQEFHIPFAEESDGVMIRLPENLLFASGSAELAPDGLKIVDKLADVLQKFPHQVRIEGHTDDTPITRSQYVANWDLSLTRAKAVMQEFVQERGLSPSRFTVAGYGETKPLVANTSEKNRAQNRRVEITVLSEQIE